MNVCNHSYTEHLFTNIVDADRSCAEESTCLATIGKVVFHVFTLCLPLLFYWIYYSCTKSGADNSSIAPEPIDSPMRVQVSEVSSPLPQPQEVLEVVPSSTSFKGVGDNKFTLTSKGRTIEVYKLEPGDDYDSKMERVCKHKGKNYRVKKNEAGFFRSAFDLCGNLR